MPNPTVDSEHAQPLVEKNHQINLISRGPLLHEVASHLLRRMLKEQYPELDIDPDKTKLGSPQWQVVDDQIESGPTRYESLTLALMQHWSEVTLADYIEGEQFLTLDPRVDNPLQLPVGIEDIARILNEAAAVLVVEFQDLQLNYWNDKSEGVPRWQALSDSLRKALDVRKVKGWDDDECALARAISADPDREARSNAAHGFDDLKAGLIDIDTVKDDVPNHLLLGGALVLQATYRDKHLVVMYTIDYGYESFSTLEQLGHSLPERIEEAAGTSLQWRLFEPEGNVFDHMALALISSQVDSIGALDQDGKFAASTDPETGQDAVEQARYNKLDVAIPDWLRNALPNDIDDYRRYITALGKLYRDPAHRLARTEIPSIERFAHQAMRDAIIADNSAHEAQMLPWDDLQINIVNSFTVDNFTLPNPHDQYTETLAQFALENEAPYLASLSFNNGTTVPDWLTVAFLTRIAAQVDVGGTYPALIKKLLIDDSLTSKRQARFYREQLRWLLPLKALEGKIKQEAGIDEQGYQYICHWLDPASDAAADMVAYPLAMTPQHRVIRASDTVANMFIISPRGESDGTCLLYRPLQEVTLMQFPSRQNLLYALHQPGELRDSILAWLPNTSLSFEYAQYVFPVGLPSPWLVAEQLVNPLLRANHFGRVQLQLNELGGDARTALFKSNAQALVTLANRQSQSNAERRWKLLKESSWAAFGVATNFLSGAVGTAAWAWQIIGQIQQGIDAHERGDTFVQWKSETDILLALGMLLSHHAMLRRKALSGKPRIPHTAVKAVAVPLGKTTVALDDNALLGELPPRHQTHIEASGAVPRLSPHALVAYLDELQTTPADLKNNPHYAPANPAKYLHPLAGKTYAKVGKRWFQVSVDEDGQVQIIDPENPGKTGPLLASDPDGHWVLDLRMRLRGGAPPSRLKALRAANELRKTELQKALNQFQRRKVNDADEGGVEVQKQSQVSKAQSDFLEATDENHDRLSAIFIEKLDDMIGAYQKALDQLKEWHTLSGGSSFINDSLRMHTELQKYIAVWFSVKKFDYLQSTHLLRSEPTINAATRAGHVRQVQEVTDLSNAMVEKLVISHKAIDSLQTLGRTGLEQAVAIRKLMPVFTEWDIKANEIGIAQELCMAEPLTAQFPEAHDEVGDLLVRGAKAAHRIAQLMKKRPGEDSPPRLIEELSELIETVADVQQRMVELPERFPGSYHQPRLDHLRSRLDTFAFHAHSLLSSALEEEQPERSKEAPRASTSRASRPAVKVHKTRPRRPVSEDVALDKGAPIGLITLDAQLRPASTLEDKDIINNSMNLVLDASSFMKRTSRDAEKPSRIPADMQDIFDQQAARLEQHASSVEQILARTKEFPVGSLAGELRAAALKMRDTGKSVRAKLYKVRKPTQSALRWMLDNGQIELHRDQGRIKTKQLGDYFQEYQILDKTDTHQAIWVAHFHYERMDSPVNSPTTAHLKVSDIYLKTLADTLQKSLTDFEPVDGVLRKIGDPDLRKVFFDLEPPVKP